MEKLLFKFDEEIPFTGLLNNNFTENKVVTFEVVAKSSFLVKEINVVLRVNETDFDFLVLSFGLLDEKIFNKITEHLKNTKYLEEQAKEFVKTVIAKEMLNELKRVLDRGNL